MQTIYLLTAKCYFFKINLLLTFLYIEQPIRAIVVSVV